MSRATGAAASGAGAKPRTAAPAADTTGARGSGTPGADSTSKGGTVTDTRDPKPYHPPKAYEPPAEGSASGSGSTSSKGSKEGRAAKTAKPVAEETEKGTAEETPAPAPKAAKAAKAVKDVKSAAAPEGPAKAPQAAQRAGEAPQQARVPRPAGPAAPAPAARPAPRTRKARLRVAKADPWSVMKVSFLLSIALGVCTIVAAAVLWTVMDAMGVFSTVGGTISDATSSEGGGFDLQSFLSLPNVLLFTTVIAVIDVVLATALATLGAFVYNLSAGFVGGVELTLAEDE
ncbi:DUF3566 domain-containing protein [Streptomyces sp. NPDC002537]